MWNTVPVERHEEHEVSFSFYHQSWEQKLCQAKAGFHWWLDKVIIRSVNKDLVKTQCCDSAYDSILYDQVTTRLSGLQAEAVEQNQSQSMGMCIVIGSSFRLQQSGFVSDGEQSRKKMEKSLFLRL